jgi:hypothetical protein
MSAKVSCPAKGEVAVEEGIPLPTITYRDGASMTFRTLSSEWN